MRARIQHALHSRARLPAMQHALARSRQRHRIAEIRDNLTARIAEAEREGWLGEIEGLKIRLATQIDRRSGHDGPVDLGTGIPVGPQQEDATRHDH
jgi:hypothetical protein